MTNLTPVLIGLTMVGAFAGVLGIILHGIGEKKKAAQAALLAARAAAPKTWVSVGLTPPEGWETALGIIRAAYDKLPAFGTIEWVAGPYTLPDGTRAAGDVVTFDPPHVRVMYISPVEQSALSHEMLHIDDCYRFGRNVYPRESPGSKDFVAEFSKVNAAIKAALGR